MKKNINQQIFKELFLYIIYSKRILSKQSKYKWWNCKPYKWCIYWIKKIFNGKKIPGNEDGSENIVNNVEKNPQL